MSESNESNKSKTKSGILVAVDFSPYSKAAIKFAAELAECHQEQLIILHVVHDPGEMPGYYSRLLSKKKLTKLEDMAEELLHKFVAKSKKELPQLASLQQAELKLVIGLPVRRILEVAAKTNVRQLIMGGKGRTGLEWILLGSKAEQVVRTCPIPVTIIKE